MASLLFAAKLIALPTSFILGSYNAVFSQNVIPHLYPLPASITTPIFARVFNIGSATIAPMAATAITAYIYLAYTSGAAADTNKRNLYGTAAVLTVATLPLTAIVMKPGINRLIEISKDAVLQSKAGVDAEATQLLKTWVVQNAFRGSLHVVAGLMALYAALT